MFPVSGEFVLFVLIASCIVFGVLHFLSHPHVVHRIVGISLSFLGMAGLYVMLEATFIAAVQVLIYAGALSILMVFAVMLTRHDETDSPPPKRWHHAGVFLGCSGLFFVIVYALLARTPPAVQPAMETNTLQDLGILLFSKWAFPFELVSLLLTVALVGAVVIAKRQGEGGSS